MIDNQNQTIDGETSTKKAINVKVNITKKHTVYRRTKMSNFGLKLSSLYGYMPMHKIIVITVATAIFFGIISVFFVKNVGIYNFGLAAFGQAAARILVTSLNKSAYITEFTRNLIDQFVFWVLYIILSIPVFIFGYKKIGKLFTNLTVLFLVVSSLVSFTIGLIPGANQVYLIGNFQNSQIKEVLPEFKKPLSGIIPLLWSDGGNIIALMIYAMVYGYLLAWIFAIIQLIGGTAGVTGVIGEWYANEKQKSFGSISGYMNIIIVLICVGIGSWLPGSLLLSEANSLKIENMREIAQAGSFKDSEVIQGIFNLKDKTQMTQFLTDKKEIINNFLASNDSAANAFANALIYKLNDLKLINNAETITKIQGQMENIGIAQEFNSVLNQFQKLTAITSKAWNFEIYLSPNFVATILTNVVYIITLNKLYPKFKLVRLEIFSDKWEQIRDIINQDEKIVTGMTIFKARGGYRDKEINVITSVSLFRHVVRVIKTVHIVDPNAFVSISDVSSIDGYVYLPEDKF